MNVKGIDADCVRVKLEIQDNTVKKEGFILLSKSEAIALGNELLTSAETLPADTTQYPFGERCTGNFGKFGPECDTCPRYMDDCRGRPDDFLEE